MLKFVKHYKNVMYVKKYYDIFLKFKLFNIKICYSN